MHNGKFYTGLPPSMLDRGGTGKNRLESHLFWPDDTKVVSAPETRSKRRTSFQPDSSMEKTRLQQQMSQAENEVDTKQMFKKEFSKSSIQFNDDLQDSADGPFYRNRHQALRSGRNLKQDITQKPTATKVDLPDNIRDEAYTNAKKKQVYNSKIQFYDYAEDDARNRNNVTRPKLDMNNKKEVERNSKNSPKLQVKSDVRNINDEWKRNNNYNRDTYTPERYIESESSTRNMIRNPVFGERKKRRDDFTENRVGSRASTLRGYREDNTRNLDYINEVEESDYRREHSGFKNNTERMNDAPKKILKNSRMEERDNDRYNEYKGEHYIDVELDYMDRKTKGLDIRASPKKNVTYRDELYDDGAPDKYYYEPDNISSWNALNAKAGSNQRQRVVGTDENEIHGDSQYMEDQSHNVRRTMSNNYKNNNNNNNQRQSSSDAARKIAPKLSITQTANSNVGNDDETPESPSDGKKHLRSSLSFHDGAIVADNEATTKTPTTAAAATSFHRRSARNSATQRVSVGLPD